MILLLTSIAFAADLPERPEPSTPREGDCESIEPLTTDTTILCAALAVPPADLADLLADREWAFVLEERYRLDTAQLAAEKTNLEWQIDQLQTALDYAREPTPLSERPGFWLGVGTAVGLGLTLGSAWAVGQIAPSG
jgi:hypothetical protein